MPQDASPEQKPRTRLSPEQKPRGLEREKSTGEDVELSKKERDELNKQYKDTDDITTKRILADNIREIAERRKGRKTQHIVPPTLSLQKEVPSKAAKKPKKNKSQTLNPYGTIKHNAFYGDNSETVLRRANKNRDTQSRKRYFLTPINKFYTTTSGKKSKSGGKRTRKYKK